MNADLDSGIPRFSLYEIALVMLIPTVFVVAVWMAFPVWDDGWLVLLVAGGGEIHRNMLDRPLVAILWQPR